MVFGEYGPKPRQYPADLIANMDEVRNFLKVMLVSHAQPTDRLTLEDACTAHDDATLGRWFDLTLGDYVTVAVPYRSGDSLRSKYFIDGLGIAIDNQNKVKLRLDLTDFSVYGYSVLGAGVLGDSSSRLYL